MNRSKKAIAGAFAALAITSVAQFAGCGGDNAEGTATPGNSSSADAVTFELACAAPSTSASPSPSPSVSASTSPSPSPSVSASPTTVASASPSPAASPSASPSANASPQATVVTQDVPIVLDPSCAPDTFDLANNRIGPIQLNPRCNQGVVEVTVPGHDTFLLPMTNDGKFSTQVSVDAMFARDSVGNLNCVSHMTGTLEGQFNCASTQSDPSQGRSIAMNVTWEREGQTTTASPSPSPSVSASPSASPSVSASPTASPSVAASPSPSPTASASASPQASPSPSASPTECVFTTPCTVNMPVSLSCSQ